MARSMKRRERMTPAIDTGGGVKFHGTDVTVPDDRPNQATIERLRAGAFLRWQDQYAGKPVTGTVVTEDLPAHLRVADTRPGRPDEFYGRDYVSPDDRARPSARLMSQQRDNEGRRYVRTGVPSTRI